jgi:hypothetical protein
MTSADHTTHRPGTAELAESETHGIDAARPFVVDSYSLLDHRTREQTIPERDAPAGRYLSLEDDGTRRLLPLCRPITHIGRGLVADVRLEDPHVSRRHAIVALRGEGVRVLDDRSANGTFVNGRPVTVAHLADGDVVRVGRAVLRYVEIAPVAASAPSPARPRATGRPLRRVAVAPARRRSGIAAEAPRRSAIG